MLSSNRVDMLSSNRVDMLSSNRVDMLSSNRVDMLNSNRVDMLNSNRVDMLSTAKLSSSVVSSCNFRGGTSRVTIVPVLEPPGALITVPFRVRPCSRASMGSDMFILMFSKLSVSTAPWEAAIEEGSSMLMRGAEAAM